jgi:hypothetical protein
MVTAPLFAACPNDRREITIPASTYFETGDSWNGPIATVRHCDGCTVASSDEAHLDKAHPLIFEVGWGDGTTSVWSTANQPHSPDLQYSNGQLKGTHKYLAALKEGTPILVTVRAQCVNIENNWPEAMNNVCGGLASGIDCTPHFATVGVFDPRPPQLAAVSKAVTHGLVTNNALAITIASAAPASGMRMGIQTNPPALRILDDKGNPVTSVIIPSGQSTWSFTIDASSLPSPTTAQVNVSSAGETVTANLSIQ